MASLNKASLASSLHAVGNVARARRTRRVVIGLLIFIVVFGLLGFFAAPPLIRHIAAQQLSEQLDRPVTIGRIALNPYTLNLEADRIHIGDRGGAGAFVDIERLIVRPSWTSLFRAAPIVDEVQIDSPRFHIVRYDAQRFNFSDLIDKFSKQPAKPDSKPTLFSVSNIHLENGSITFDDRLLGEKHVIDQWKLGVPFIATLPSKTDIFVEPVLRMRIDGSPLAVDGKTKPFAQSRESEMSLRFDGLDVPRLLSYAPSKLPVTVQSGKLSSDLQLNFVMSGDTPTLRVSGTTDLADLDVRDGHNAPFFAAHQVHVGADLLEPLKSVYHFNDIRVDAPSTHLARDKDGIFSIQRIFAAQPGATPAAKAAANGEASSRANSEANSAANGAANGGANPEANSTASAPGAASAPQATASAPTAPAAAAAAPLPLDLTVKRFTLSDGTVEVADAAASRPVTTTLTNVGMSLTDFSSIAKTPARYSLSLTSKKDGGTLNAAGSFGMVAKTADAKLDLKSISLPALQPYLDTATAAQVLDGKLNASVNLNANWAQSPPAVQVGASTLDLQSLKVAGPGDKQPAIALAQGHVALKGVDVGARKADIESVDASGLAVDATRLKDGKIDLLALAGPPQQTAQERTAIHAVKKAQETGPAWHYTIGALNLKDGSATFTDESTARPVKVTFAPLQLKVQKISDDMSRPLPIDLQTTVNRKGTLGVSGDVTASPLKLALKLDANRLDAAAFEPYFGNQLNATVASALVSAKGDVALAQEEQHGKAGGLKASYRGDAALVDVRMLDKVTSAPFAGWRSLALTNLKADYDARGTDVDASRVTFSDFYGRVVLDAQGKLNLSDIKSKPGDGGSRSLTQSKGGRPPIPLTPPAVAEATGASEAGAGSAAVTLRTPAGASGASAAATASASATATASAPAPASVPRTSVAANGKTQPAQTASGAPVKLHFGQLVLQNGRVTYTDNFVKPNYTANLVAIHGTVGAFGTQSTTPAPVDIAAKLAANGPLSIRGTVNPLIAQPALDLTATAHDIELTNLTPYSAKYAGYPITKGKLNVDLHYKLENNQLSANNHLFIDQLTFGDRVENDTATKLPVKLAISLLKNSRGEIDVDIPVSGSLDNPEFSIGGLIWHAVLNLLQKAVTAPFTLLAHAFGGGNSAADYGHVEFAAGSAKLSDAANQKLDTIAKALADKPSVRIDLIGRVDPAVDEPALRTRYVDRLVKQEKLKDVVGNGESIDTSNVTVSPDEYHKYLVKAYKDADFKKPSNFIGMTKTLPDDDMKAALAEHAQINEASLRDLAQRRAQAVQQYFDGKIDSSRVFIVAPKLDASGIDDKGATTRVDFGLK